MFRIEILKDTQRQKFVVPVVQPHERPPELLHVDDQDIRNLEGVADLIQGYSAEGATNKDQALLTQCLGIQGHGLERHAEERQLVAAQAAASMG